MKIVSEKGNLFEMPMLIAGKHDFGLSDAARNRAEYERLADSDYKAIEENERYLLAMSFDREESRFEIFLLNYKARRLAYYVEYVPHAVPQIGMCATQVILWRLAGAGVPGVTTKVFYDVLLKSFNGIVSDVTQTEDGRRFWIDRMAEAADQGFVVGLMNDGEITSIFDPQAVAYEQWLADNNGWGEASSFKSLRYFIAKKVA